jgi:hypothetical protein
MDVKAWRGDGGARAVRWGVLVPQSGADSTEEVPIDADEQVWIGTSAECQLVLPRAPGISEMHCLVQGTGTGVQLADDSTAGTFINGQRFQRNKKILKNGDEIKIGSASFSYQANNRVRRTVSSFDGVASSSPRTSAALAGGKEKTLSRYQTLDDVIVRAGFEMDSELVTNLPAGKVVKIVEERVNMAGTLRVRSKHGWMSVHAKSGNQLMVEVKKTKKPKKDRASSRSMDAQSFADPDDDDDASSESSKSSRSSRSSTQSGRSPKGMRGSTKFSRQSWSMDDTQSMSLDGSEFSVPSEADEERSAAKSKSSRRKYLASVHVPDAELRRREHKVKPLLAEADKAFEQYGKMKGAAEGVIAALRATVEPSKELAGALLAADKSKYGWTPARVATTFDDVGKITTRFANRAHEQVVQVAQAAMDNIQEIRDSAESVYMSSREDYDAALGKMQHLEQEGTIDARASKGLRSARKDFAATERAYREHERQLLEQVVEALCAKELHEVEFAKVLMGAQIGRAKATAEVIKRLPGVGVEGFGDDLDDDDEEDRASRRRARGKSRSKRRDDDEEEEEEEEEEAEEEEEEEADDDDDTGADRPRRRPPSSDEEDLDLPDISDEDEDDDDDEPRGRTRPPTDSDEDDDDEERRGGGGDDDSDEDSDGPRSRRTRPPSDSEEDDDDGGGDDDDSDDDSDGPRSRRTRPPSDSDEDEDEDEDEESRPSGRRPEEDDY